MIGKPLLISGLPVRRQEEKDLNSAEEDVETSPAPCHYTNYTVVKLAPCSASFRCSQRAQTKIPPRSVWRERHGRRGAGSEMFVLGHLPNLGIQDDSGHGGSLALSFGRLVRSGAQPVMRRCDWLPWLCQEVSRHRGLHRSGPSAPSSWWSPRCCSGAARRRPRPLPGSQCSA